MALRDALTERAVETIDWPITGRTHGMHAEPTTFGAKFSLFALQVQRDVERAQRARSAIAVGKLSGPSGRTRTSIPRSKRTSAPRSASCPVPATQVIARDRHAEVLYACAALGTRSSSSPLEVRLPRAQRGR